MTEPRATVCLAVHDGARFIVESVASILAQSERALELLLVDDGSSDDTAALLGRLDDPRVTVIHQEHRGLSAALNRCIELARAPLLVRMDADDVALPDRLARQLAFMDARPEVAACGSAIAYFADGGTRTLPVRLPAEHAEILARLRRGGHAFCHPTMVIRREAARRAGGYRVAGPGQLTDFALALAAQGRLANLTEVLLRKRVHAASASWRHSVAVAAADLAARRRHRDDGAGSPDGAPLPAWSRVLVRRRAAAQVLYRRALVAWLQERRAAAAAAAAMAAVLAPARAVRRLRGTFSGPWLVARGPA